MTDIFLSYNREDQTRAKLFADAFAAAGMNVWWDTALRSGEAYDEVTEAALRAAKAVVVLWSPRSVVSRWVRAEATIADRCKTLVPVTIEPCERPIMFELTQTAELSHWTGDVADQAWLAFLDDVRGMAAKEPVPAVVVPTLPPPSVEETLKPGQSGSAPSLAVLPFTNRSGLPEDEVFAEGMVEDIISALSQGVNVRVLGATTTANLSRAAIVDLPMLGCQLGVHYLLEGNVRRMGANLRVTTQLLEAETGAVMWTGKFDRPLSELAELQEELVSDIAASLDTQVFSQETERALRKPADITAWEAVTRAWSAYREYDASSLQRVLKEAQRAIAIAPDYALGHAALAVALADAYLVSPDNPAEVARIRAIAKRALALAPDDAAVLGPVGQALSYMGDTEEGARCTERAVRKAPGSGTLNMHHGAALFRLGRWEQALSHFKTAERLMPDSYMMWLVKSWQVGPYIRLGRWAEAEAAIDESLSLLPTAAPSYLSKAQICLHFGRNAEARRHIGIAQSLGLSLAEAERFLHRILPSNPTLENDIATLRALYTPPDAET